MSTETENAKFEQLNPILCGLYQAVWNLQAVQYMEEELALGRAEGGEKWNLAILAEKIARESASDIHNLLEQLCEAVGVSPNCNALD